MSDAEYLAMMFHNYYQELAPQIDYKTREETAVPWSEVPPKNKWLMIAVAKKLLNGHVAIITKPGEEMDEHHTS